MLLLLHAPASLRGWTPQLTGLIRKSLPVTCSERSGGVGGGGGIIGERKNTEAHYLYSSWSNQYNWWRRDCGSLSIQQTPAKRRSVHVCPCMHKGIVIILCMNVHMFTCAVFASKLGLRWRPERWWHSCLYAAEKMLFIRISCFRFMINSHGTQKQYIHETGKKKNRQCDKLPSRFKTRGVWCIKS